MQSLETDYCICVMPIIILKSMALILEVQIKSFDYKEWSTREVSHRILRSRLAGTVGAVADLAQVIERVNPRIVPI